jgi:hypothetical protein
MFVVFKVNLTINERIVGANVGIKKAHARGVVQMECVVQENLAGYRVMDVMGRLEVQHDMSVVYQVSTIYR